MSDLDASDLDQIDAPDLVSSTTFIDDMPKSRPMSDCLRFKSVVMPISKAGSGPKGPLPYPL